MATAFPEEDCDITKCTICLEEFKTPKYLPCLHTFCEACLNSYITSVFSNGTTKTHTVTTFDCPVCRGSVRPADSSTPYQEWAGQFPLNHLIVTLIDQNKLKAKVKLCDPCKYGNDDVIALTWCADCNEALCDTCKNSHKKSKASRNHFLQNIDEISSIPLLTSLQSCVNHKGKNVDAFCVDHDQPCCTTCIAIHHRKCDHVTTLEEAAQGTVESKAIFDLFTRLAESSRLIDETLKEKKENMVELEKQKGEIQEEIKTLRLRISKYLDTLESEIMQELSTMHKQKVTELTDLINDLENRQKVIQNSKNLMSTCKKRANDIHVFLEMKKVERKQKEEEEKIQQILNNHRQVQYQFDRNTKAEDLLYSVKSYGTVTVKEEGISSRIKCSKNKTVLLKDCTPNKVSSFSVGESSWIYGGVFLPDKTLMLALYGGKKLVKYSTTGDAVQQTSFSGYVYGVSMIDSNVAVVTRPDNKAIDFVDIQTLRVTKSVSTNDTCYGISYDDNKLYIGCYYKLLILNRNGDKVNEIPTKNLVYAITFIKEGEKKIVYINYCTHSCHFIRVSDMKEIHTFTHKDLQNPHCVTSDRDGNVYTAGHSSGNVFQISSEGKLIQIILSGMDNPSGIQFDGDSNKFFVAYSHPSNVDIYEMVEP